jgi:hypothetical protein
MEDISYLLRIPQRKPYGTMEGNVKKALKVYISFLLFFGGEGVSFILMLYRRGAILNKHCFHPKLKRAVH